MTVYHSLSAQQWQSISLFLLSLGHHGRYCHRHGAWQYVAYWIDLSSLGIDPQTSGFHRAPCGKAKGGAVVINCWLLFIMIAMLDHHRLVLSIPSWHHCNTPPGCLNIIEHLARKARKKSIVVLDCWLLLNYFSSWSTQLLIVMLPRIAVTYTAGMP